MSDMNFRGRWVLLTGASSGLGETMAKQLAREHGAHLILVARRQDRLDALAETLRKEGTQVEVIAADLGKMDGVDEVLTRLGQLQPIYAAFLNAGITHFGHFDELPFEEFQKMLALNVEGTVKMLRGIVPGLEQRRENGGVLLVASLAGLTPVSYQAHYSGTKAFLVNYGCSLHHELKPRGVTVTVFAPGGIQTEMTQGQRFNDLRNWLVPVDPCAREAITALKTRKYLAIPGVIYGVGARLTRLLPQNLLVGKVAEQYRNSLKKNS